MTELTEQRRAEIEREFIAWWASYREGAPLGFNLYNDEPTNGGEWSQWAAPHVRAGYLEYSHGAKFTRSAGDSTACNYRVTKRGYDYWMPRVLVEKLRRGR